MDCSHTTSKLPLDNQDGADEAAVGMDILAVSSLDTATGFDRASTRTKERSALVNSSFVSLRVPTHIHLVDFAALSAFYVMVDSFA